MTETNTALVDDVPDLATAVAELNDAKAETLAVEAREASLDARVLAGDPDVTPDALTQAAGLSRFAKLREQAAANRHVRAQAADRAARLEVLADHARAYATKHGENGSATRDAALARFEAAVTSAVHTLASAEATQRADFQALLGEADRAGIPASDLSTGRHVPPYRGDHVLALPSVAVAMTTGHGAPSALARAEAIASAAIRSAATAARSQR